MSTTTAPYKTPSPTSDMNEFTRQCVALNGGMFPDTVRETSGMAWAKIPNDVAGSPWYRATDKRNSGRCLTAYGALRLLADGAAMGEVTK